MPRAFLPLLGVVLILGVLLPADAQVNLAAALPSVVQGAPPVPRATPDKLPRWRGFNLLNKFVLENNTPFEEADFRRIHGWGFNFVRIPMDYRIWIVGGDWTKIDEKAAFADLDQAVAWAEKYDVHISLNFHRAPGYCVNAPVEARSLWTDPEAQRVCALHWAAFARHFKAIPSDYLSFDLVNEPANIDAATYAKVVAIMANAIRTEDPHRLIICDGLQWGNQPVPELNSLHVAQSMHDYMPMEVTHYHASWIPGSSTWPVPQWPIFRGVPGNLYGPDKPDLSSPLTIQGPSGKSFPAGTRLEVKVGTVSFRGRLVIRADGELDATPTHNDIVFQKAFDSGPESTEGEKVVYKPEWKVYQNVFAQTETITLTKSAKQITISNDDGDWMTLDSLTIRAPSYPAFSMAFTDEFGKKRGGPLILNPDVPSMPWSGADGEWLDRKWIHARQIVPWQQLGNQGVGIMVGEWGCYNQTPYEVTMRWMADSLAEFKKAGWGWALWNLNGSFGILDSDRPGAVYEDFEGHKLDTRMLRLLQEN